MRRLMPAVIPLGLAAASLSVVALANADSPEDGASATAPKPVAAAAPAPAAPKAPAPAPAQQQAPEVAPAPAEANEVPAAAETAPKKAAPKEEFAPKEAVKSLPINYEAQLTGYWCGPAATRIAMSSQTQDLPDQASLASGLGTTTNGTDHIRQVTDFMNNALGADKYKTVDWGGKPLTDEMKQQLWQDTVKDIDEGKALVANIVAPPGNQPPNYPSSQTIYHYVSIVGYDAPNQKVQIADPANFGGQTTYWLSLDQAASLIQPKGYSH
jgi:hypothetical protein